MTVQRTPVDSQDKAAKPEVMTIDVAPNPIRELGLEMEMGEICAIQKDSPAALAGLKRGDIIRMIDGQPVGDPMTLPDRFSGRGRETINLTIEREGEKVASEVQATLRGADWYVQPLDEKSPMAWPSLGIAYRVLNRVRMAVPGSPAAEAGLTAGDEIVGGKLIPPDKETLRKLEIPAIGGQAHVRRRASQLAVFRQLASERRAGHDGRTHIRPAGKREHRLPYADTGRGSLQSRPRLLLRAGLCLFHRRFLGRSDRRWRRRNP